MMPDHAPRSGVERYAPVPTRDVLSLMRRRMSHALCLVLGWLALSGHIGSSQVVFEGRAGGYPVRVVITPPGVVPAQVPILVRVLDGAPTRVTVRAAQWNLGTKGAPPAEEAAVVPGDPGVWSHDLWIMTSSTYAVHVAVEGPAGAGSFIVPLQTSATRTLGMTPVMSGVLLALGTLLVAGLLTIVGAAAREGSLLPGERPTPKRRRTARVAMAGTAALLGLALFGGAAWWNAEEGDYKRRMLKPIPMTAAVRTVDDDRVLTIAITDSLWRSNRSTPLMPDHGKLMHLFLIRADDTDAIAHLHPLRVHADTFVTRLPALPQGRYLLFGDLLFQSGTQRTLVDTVDVPVAPVVAGGDDGVPVALATSVPPLDPDDAWRVTQAVALGERAVLTGGGSMQLDAEDARGGIAAGRDLRLRASVRNDDGSEAALEPYMGMGGHAMVLRRDGGVFVHLHPMGTASMTAQAQLARRERGDTAFIDPAVVPVIDPAVVHSVVHADMTSQASPGMSHGETLSFPFVFPGPGQYRLFVQVKRRGVVETAAFDVQVARPPAGSGPAR